MGAFCVEEGNVAVPKVVEPHRLADRIRNGREPEAPTDLLPGGALAFPSDRRYAMAMEAIDGHVAGSLLRSARLRLGLSQTGFADVLGIAQPTLSAYESGHRQPTLPTLLRMLNRAGLDLRLELVESDDHDRVLAEWERTLDDATRQRLRSQGYRLVSDTV